MRISTLAGALLGSGALLAGIALAADAYLAKGKTLTVDMTTTADMSGTSSQTDMTIEYTITDVGKKTITYDIHMTGKGSAGGTSYDMPATDLKAQTSDRPGPDSAGDDASTVEVEVEAGGLFKGKVHVVHAKSEGSESWASAHPFEAELKLAGGGTFKAHCAYAKSVSDASGTKSVTEVLSLSDFPVVSAYMHSRSEGNGMTSETTSRLRRIK